jgi:transporter family protein
MHAAVLFALVSMVLVGVGDFVYKRAAVAGAVPSSFLLVQSWFFGATAFVFGLLTGTLRYHPALWLGPAAALTVFAGARMFLHSLRHGEATVNTPIFRLSFVITVALAILFLGERLTPRKLLGFALAAAAILLLTAFPLGRLARGALGGTPARPILWALAAMGCMGLLNFIYKVAAHLGATAPAFIFSQFCAFTLIALFHALWWEGGLRLDRAVWLHAPFAGVFISAGFIVLILALQRGEASVAVPISQMSFVMTTVLAAIVYREAFTLRKSLGLAAAILTILVFNA